MNGILSLITWQHTLCLHTPAYTPHLDHVHYIAELKGTWFEYWYSGNQHRKQFFFYMRTSVLIPDSQHFLILWKQSITIFQDCWTDSHSDSFVCGCNWCCMKDRKFKIEKCTRKHCLKCPKWEFQLNVNHLKQLKCQLKLNNRKGLKCQLKCKQDKLSNQV